MIKFQLTGKYFICILKVRIVPKENGLQLLVDTPYVKTCNYCVIIRFNNYWQLP